MNTPARRTIEALALAALWLAASMAAQEYVMGARPRAFSIGNVSEVKVWAEPDSAFYALSGGRLSTWGDTGGGRVALVPDTNTPLWEADSGNGIGGFLFDQTRPDCIKTSASVSVTTFALWIGYKDANGNQTILVEHSSNINSSNGFLLYSDTIYSLMVKKTAGTSQKIISSFWASDGSNHHIRWEFGGTHALNRGWLDSALQSTTNGPNTADPGSVSVSDTLHVGCRDTGSVPLHGPLQFFVFASPFPSAGDVAAITDDLTTRFY